MKKLKLNLSTLPGAEILTREQLKKVVGGMYSGEGGVSCDCNSSDDCKNTNKPTCFAGEAYNCKTKPGESYTGVCDKF